MERIPLLKPIKKVVTVLSGGMDSTILAYLLHSQGYTQTFCSFDYGQRHRRELDKSSITTKKLGGKHHIIVLSAFPPLLEGQEGRRGSDTSLASILGGSALTDNVPVPEGHYAQENMALTIVPGRNAMMLSIAWSVAVAEKSNLIACGVHKGDYIGYPDCRPSFVSALGVALRLGSGLEADYKGTANVILAPFIYVDKAEIVHQGLKLGVPFEDTWTCYKGKDKACGLCGSCTERLEAFSKNNAEDPLEYEDRTTWKKIVADFKVKGSYA